MRKVRAGHCHLLCTERWLQDGDCSLTSVFVSEIETNLPTAARQQNNCWKQFRLTDGHYQSCVNFLILILTVILIQLSSSSFHRQQLIRRKLYLPKPLYNGRWICGLQVSNNDCSRIRLPFQWVQQFMSFNSMIYCRQSVLIVSSTQFEEVSMGLPLD